MNISFKTLIAALAVCVTAGCSSDDPVIPATPEAPEAPVIGAEVPADVIYEANPRLFAQNECLRAMTAQLPRIADMGCDVVWVMPVFEPGELNSIGSPYCIRDFESVNPRYGTMADLRTLVSTAHDRGMKVILDWVGNHTAWDHPWITSAPDRYVHDNGGNIISPSGWNDVAQLDYSNAGTRRAMLDAMLYWVREAGIDGYRCDYADGVPHDFWSDAIKALRGIDADILMLAESADKSFYADGFDMVYDWKSSTTIADTFGGGRPSAVITEATGALEGVPEGKSILRYVFNHDVAADNAMDRMYGSADAIPAAYVLASMLNGTPMIYSAMDAAGVSGKLSFFNYNPLDFSAGLTARYKAINSAFKASADVRRGTLGDYSADRIVCFTRTIPGHTLLVAVNTSGSTQTARMPITLSRTEMHSLLDGETVTLPIELELEPYGYTILMN